MQITHLYTTFGVPVTELVYVYEKVW